MTWVDDEPITDTKINKPFAQYQINGGQVFTSGITDEISFLSPIATSPYVVPGSAFVTNDYFTISPGLWRIVCGFRLGGTATNTLQLFLYDDIAYGTANVQAVGGGVGQAQVVHTYAAYSPTAIGVAMLQTSGTDRTAALYGLLTGITFVRRAEL